MVGAASNKAFLWEDGVMTALPGLGGSGGVGATINASGLIVGTSNLNLNSTPRAVLWDNGVITNLTPNLTSSDTSTASGINDTGQVVGNINYETAFLWQNGTITALEDLGAGASAVDINDAGQVAGWSYYTQIAELGSVAHPLLWENGVMRDLGLLLPGDDDGWAGAINEVGQIVGSSGRTDPQTYVASYRAFLYENGVMTALPVPSSDSYAGDINDSGVVVGAMKAGPGVFNYDAFIYADGVVTNLNSLIASGSGLHLMNAVGINNDGQSSAWPPMHRAAHTPSC